MKENGEGTRAPLPQLLHPQHYSPCTFDYLSKGVLSARGSPTYTALEDWVGIFRHSIPSFKATAASDTSLPEHEAARRAEAFADDFARRLEAVEHEALAHAAPHQAASCLALCALREDSLRRAGFADAFRGIKRKENAAAVALLPAVCAGADAVPPGPARAEALLRGVFAGNVFDLGAAATAEMYHSSGGTCFVSALAALLPRPWVVDDLDAAVAALSGAAPYERAILFVDNAGADVILGMLPLARELLRQGTDVVLAANSLPAINDITAAELDALLPALAAADDAVCKGISSGRLRVIASGSSLPVIDLSQLSPELVEACVSADLIVLEGMGRAIETNLRAALACDSLKLGMVKHPEVAAALGGRMYDCVCRFVPGGQETG